MGWRLSVNLLPAAVLVLRAPRSSRLPYLLGIPDGVHFTCYYSLSGNFVLGYYNF